MCILWVKTVFEGIFGNYEIFYIIPSPRLPMSCPCSRTRQRKGAESQTQSTRPKVIQTSMLWCLTELQIYERYIQLKLTHTLETSLND